MVIGDHIAVFRDDEAAAGGSHFRLLTVNIGGCPVGDSHHAVYIHGVNLTCRKTVGRGNSVTLDHIALLGSSGSLFRRFYPALQLLQLLFIGIVGNSDRSSEGAAHQHQGQHRGNGALDDLTHGLSLLFLFFDLFCLLRRFCVITARIVLGLMFHHVRGIGKGRLFPAHTGIAVGLLRHRFRRSGSRLLNALPFLLNRLFLSRFRLIFLTQFFFAIHIFKVIHNRSSLVGFLMTLS